MTSRFARTLLVVLGLIAATVPASAQGRGSYERDGSFHLRLGMFQPLGDSEYWDDKALDFTGEAEDLESISVGGDYVWHLSRHVGIMFSGSYFQGDTTQAYIDFVDNLGNRIRHDTTLEIAAAEVGLVFQLTGPNSPVIPYVGAGGGLYSWQLSEDGDFIDFGPGVDEIFTARLESDGVVLGFYGLVGLEVPISHNLSFFAEGRFTRAEDEMSGDFEGFGDIDLSGQEIAGGIAWSF